MIARGDEKTLCNREIMQHLDQWIYINYHLKRTHGHHVIERNTPISGKNVYPEINNNEIVDKHTKKGMLYLKGVSREYILQKCGYYI